MTTLHKAACAAILLLSACGPDTDTGREDYAALCSSCHGEAGRGDGWAAGAQDSPPPDLTGIAARNGGVFDRVSVMSRIDGYARDGDGTVMPRFGALLEGETVLVETAEGVLTPTPRRLVALADYVASLQSAP